MAYKNMVNPKGGPMDRTLFSPTMLEAFRACKRAYYLAYHRGGADQVRDSASGICKRFILRGLAQINRSQLTSVSQIQKFMGQHWPLEKLSLNFRSASQAEAKEGFSRAFLFCYKTLKRYLAQPYCPDGAEVAGVSLKVRTRVQNERIYLEDVFDLILWYPREQKLELVIFSLRQPREVDQAWPSPSILVRQHLAERLRMRFPFKRLVLTNVKVGPQEMKVSSREMSESLYRIHWPEIVKNLMEMKEMMDVPLHSDADCSYCQILESRMVMEEDDSLASAVISQGEPVTVETVPTKGESEGDGYSLSA